MGFETFRQFHTFYFGQDHQAPSHPQQKAFASQWAETMTCIQLPIEKKSELKVAVWRGSRRGEAISKKSAKTASHGVAEGMHAERRARETLPTALLATDKQ